EKALHVNIDGPRINAQSSMPAFQIDRGASQTTSPSTGLALSRLVREFTLKASILTAWFIALPSRLFVRGRLAGLLDRQTRQAGRARAATTGLFAYRSQPDHPQSTEAYRS